VQKLAFGRASAGEVKKTMLLGKYKEDSL